MTVQVPTQLPVMVGGRAFRPPTEMTYEHDMYMIQLLQSSGLDKLMDVFNPVEDDLSELAKDLIIRAFATGKMFRVLATALVEDGIEWSIAECDKNEQFFKGLKKREDKDALQSSILMVLLSFIVSGVLSSRTSRNYSLGKSNTPLHTSVVPQHDSEAVRATISESGTTSSAPLPDTIPFGSPSS